MDFLYGSETVWAETKYDGERAQIHVEVRPDGSSHITIFSKSKRDSTHDRQAVHHLIRAALGLSGESATGKVRQNVILDAEMVAFHGDKVAGEFYFSHYVSHIFFTKIFISQSSGIFAS